MGPNTFYWRTVLVCDAPNCDRHGLFLANSKTQYGPLHQEVSLKCYAIESLTTTDWECRKDITCSIRWRQRPQPKMTSPAPVFTLCFYFPRSSRHHMKLTDTHTHKGCTTRRHFTCFQHVHLKMCLASTDSERPRTTGCCTINKDQIEWPGNAAVKPRWGTLHPENRMKYKHGLYYVGDVPP